MVQRELNFAIVDEVDSILVDEARTPLIISGAGEKSTDMYHKADRFVIRLKNEIDFEIDEKAKTINLTEEGEPKLKLILMWRIGQTWTRPEKIRNWHTCPTM